MRNEDVIKAIRRYIQFPDCKWKGSFKRSEEVAISRWAAMEVRKAILAHPDVPARDTIDWFYGEMVRCMLLANKQSQKDLFRVAADAADVIRCMI